MSMLGKRDGDAVKEKNTYLVRIKPKVISSQTSPQNLTTDKNTSFIENKWPKNLQSMVKDAVSGPKNYFLLTKPKTTSA